MRTESLRTVAEPISRPFGTVAASIKTRFAPVASLHRASASSGRPPQQRSPSAIACEAAYTHGEPVSSSQWADARKRHHAQPSLSAHIFKRAATLLLFGIAPLCAAEPPSSVKSFVAANCVDCHDESSEKGGF